MILRIALAIVIAVGLALFVRVMDSSSNPTTEEVEREIQILESEVEERKEEVFELRDEVLSVEQEIAESEYLIVLAKNETPKEEMINGFFRLATSSNEERIEDLEQLREDLLRKLGR